MDNVDLFAWTVADIPGVNPDIITHRLSIYKEARLVTEKKRKLREERCHAAWEEAKNCWKPILSEKRTIRHA